MNSNNEAAGIHTILLSKKERSDFAKTTLTDMSNYAEDNKNQCVFTSYSGNKEFEKFHQKKKNKSISSKFKESPKNQWTLHLKKQGLSISVLEVYDPTPSKKYVNYFIQYELNPAILLGGRNYLRICTEADFEIVCEIVNRLVGYIMSSPLLMEDMNVVRVDFCRNINLSVLGLADPEAVVKLYLKMLKNCKQCKGFKLIYDRDDDGEDYPHENYTKLKKEDIELYFYSKFAEMSSKPCYSDRDIAESYGVLRLEVRVQNAALYHEKKKTGIYDSIGFLNHAISISQYKFERYLKNLFFTSDYHTYETAIEIIDNSENIYKNSNRDLQRLIFHINKSRGISIGINKMKEELKNEIQESGKEYKPHKVNRKIENMFAQLEKLNINPVTIPQRDQINFLLGEKSLPNLLSFF